MLTKYLEPRVVNLKKKRSRAKGYTPTYEEVSHFNLSKNEYRLINEALAYTGGCKDIAAQILGINRKTLYYKLKKAR